MKSFAFVCKLSVWIVMAFFSPMALADDYFDRYGLVAASPMIDLGVQPLSYPAGVVAAAMRRDRLLKKTLAENNQGLLTHPFRRGADMLRLLAERRLEGGIFGDVPTLLASSAATVWIVGLLEQSQASIVAKKRTTMKELVGKRIGYVRSSTAHNILLQGLASAGLNDSQVTLVPINVYYMPDALERGDIDAFAGWEPATSISLRKSDKNHIVFKEISLDYFVLERSFVQRDPKTARHVVAGMLRAIAWLRQSPSNLEKAVRWAMLDAANFSGRPETLPAAEIAAMTHRNLLDIPSAPAIASSPDNSPLKKQFDFLASIGKLPEGAKWTNVEASFAYDGLGKVMAEPKKYQINIYDYEE